MDSEMDPELDTAAASPGADDSGSAAGPGAPRAGRRGGTQRKRSFWRELPILVAVALLLAVIIKTYAIQAFYIP